MERSENTNTVLMTATVVLLVCVYLMYYRTPPTDTTSKPKEKYTNSFIPNPCNKNMRPSNTGWCWGPSECRRGKCGQCPNGGSINNPYLGGSCAYKRCPDNYNWTALDEFGFGHCVQY